MTYANQANFPTTIGNGLVLVDFFATWCGPCKMLSPVLEAIDQENGDLVKVVKVNVDEERELSESYAISAVPTMILFKNGKPVNRIMGYKTKNAILEIVKSYR